MCDAIIIQGAINTSPGPYAVRFYYILMYVYIYINAFLSKPFFHAKPPLKRLPAPVFSAKYLVRLLIMRGTIYKQPCPTERTFCRRA